MKKILFLALVAVAVAVASFDTAFTSRDGETVRVLFIGNSLTSANNLPAMVAAIAKSHGDKLIYAAHTPGGARFSQHAASRDVLEKLRQQDWDFVVLQERANCPVWEPVCSPRPYIPLRRIWSRRPGRPTSRQAWFSI